MNLIQLLNRITVAPELDFGNIFGESIDLFKKTWGQGVVFILVNMALAVPAIIILYMPMIVAATSGVSQADIEAGNLSIWYQVVFGLLFLPIIAVIQTITLGLTAGFYRIVKDLDHNQNSQGTSLFMFFKKGHLGKLFLIAIISLGITILATLLCFFPVFYVAIPVGLFPVIFAFNPELTSSEIVKAAFKLGNKKWLLLFGLTIVAYFLSQIVGLLLCGIGLFVTASFVYLPIYLVYKQSVGFEQTKEISQIETSEI